MKLSRAATEPDESRRAYRRRLQRVVRRLAALLPDLEYSRQTHVDWRDCEQKYRDANPDIGDADFHEQCVRDYDERIGTIKEAIDLLNETTPN